MGEYLSPGVYVEEYDSSPRSIEGVGTSTAGFVGMAVKGPAVGAPVLITSSADFERTFGGPLSEFTHGEFRYLSGSVEQFFENGGTRCYVARVIPEDAKKAAAQSGSLTVEAANEGSWGNRIQITLTSAARKKLQLLQKTGDKTYVARSVDGFTEGDTVAAGESYNRILTIFDNVVTFEKPFEQEVVDPGLVPRTVLYLVEADIQVRYGEEAEIYSAISFNTAAVNYIERCLKKSKLIGIKLSQDETAGDPLENILGNGVKSATITLSGGSDGSLGKVNAETFIGVDRGAGRRTGIQAFLENPFVSMMAVPGITIPEVIVSLVAHCENMASRFAVLDVPRDLIDTKEILEYREMIDSTYAAMYHPWIEKFDRSAKKTGYFPPSGAVMGVYARTDVSRGVHKAPANEVIKTGGLNISFNKQEQDILNPAGVNLIRALPGQGIRIWGARTASSNSSFKYVNVRRLFIYVEESIKRNTNWVVFEPNDASLWSRVSITINSFLETLWRSGMLAGESPAESYFVEIGQSTMTNDDILNGRLICNIGIAPSRPAEFIIFRVTQFTAGAAGAAE